MKKAALFIAIVACSGQPAPQTTCEPGTNVFCRCPGGDPGTRECRADATFGECVIAPGTACGQPVTCEAGTSISCLCPDGTEGQKTCRGDGYDECLVGGEPCALEPWSEPPDEPPIDEPDPGGGGGGSAPATCGHPVCQIGGPLGDGCSECVSAVCDAESYCCTSSWDTGCVEAANSHPACGSQCCAHSECTTGVRLSHCSACAIAVCQIDSWCCDNEWDSYCVEKAQASSACSCE